MKLFLKLSLVALFSAFLIPNLEAQINNNIPQTQGVDINNNDIKDPFDEDDLILPSLPDHPCTNCNLPRTCYNPCPCLTQFVHNGNGDIIIDNGTGLGSAAFTSNTQAMRTEGDACAEIKQGKVTKYIPIVISLDDIKDLNPITISTELIDLTSNEPVAATINNTVLTFDSSVPESEQVKEVAGADVTINKSNFENQSSECYSQNGYLASVAITLSFSPAKVSKTLLRYREYKAIVTVISHDGHQHNFIKSFSGATANGKFKNYTGQTTAKKKTTTRKKTKKKKRNKKKTSSRVNNSQITSVGKADIEKTVLGKQDHGHSYDVLINICSPFKDKVIIRK